MDGLVPLTTAAANDPAITGRKASGLARATAAGLPVLPGWVLPLHESATAIAVGVEALERAGRAAAVLATSRLDLTSRVARDLELVGDTIGTAAAVRSSTERDGDGRWAGAFASYLDVEGGLLPVAVRGCWSAVFSRDVLARCAEAGTEVGRLRVATLIQPWVAFEAGGVARCGAGGGVSVTAAAGAPGGIVGGRRSGVTVEVPPGGARSGTGNGQSLDPGMVRAVADLARATAEGTGEDAIEWGWAQGGAFLLQASTTGGTPRPPPRPSGSWSWMSPRAEALAWIVARHGGPLGEELVIPWALGCARVPATDAIAVHDPAAAVAEARSIAGTLVAQVWGRPADDARQAAAAATRQLLGPHPERGMAAIERLSPPAEAPAVRVLGLVAGVAGRFPATARREHPGRDRWTPFVFHVVRARGREARGRPCAPGFGVGGVHPLRGLRSLSVPDARSILAAPLPLPQLSPLLWHVSGVVSEAGGPGAHLFEVARSLGVPAVAGVDLLDDDVEGVLVAVDGDEGAVSILEVPPHNEEGG